MPMGQKPVRRQRPPRGIWDGDDFTDISSHSDGEPPQRARPLREPAGGRKPRQGARPERPAARPAPRRGGRPAEGGRPGSPQRPASQRRGSPAPPPKARRPREPQPRKRKPPMSKGLRRLITFGVLAMMAAATWLLAVSLLFKISAITVTGDQVYQAEDILRLCDYRVGENLFFVSTKDREEKLKAQLPYIAEVDIRRHIPGTLEIHITGTEVACCIAEGGSWLYVSGEGKILERQAEPRPGVMQIEGLSPVNPQTGQSVELGDQGVQEAYSQILSVIVELGAWGAFTRLDLSDPYNITLWYQDRVEFRLGNAAELPYKIQFGYKLLQEGKIGPEESGVLDLTYADVRRAGFTSTPGSASSASPPPGGANTGQEDGSGGDSDAGDSQEDTWEPGGEEEGDTEWDAPEEEE